MKKTALLLIFVLILSGCALMEVPEPVEEAEEGLVEEVPEEEDGINITLPEKKEEPISEGGVTFGQITLPTIADIMGENAYLTLTIPYTYTGPDTDRDNAVDAALQDIRVAIHGIDADLTVVTKTIGISSVIIQYSFPQGPATRLTRIMYGPNTALSSRKRISYLPKKETTTTTTAPTANAVGVSDSFIRYGIPEIIKDKNNDKLIIIELHDRYARPFTIRLFMTGYGATPEYKVGGLGITFEWLMLANEDATITWDMLNDYEYILFSPPSSQENYVIAFSSDTLKNIRENIYKTEITPDEGVVASIELTTKASGRGVLQIGGEDFYVDLKKIVGSAQSVIPRKDAESSSSSTNEIPVRFFVTGNDQGLYLVEYKQ